MTQGNPGQAPIIGGGVPADLGARFLARLIDGVVFMLVFFIIALILGAILGGSASPFGLGLTDIVASIIFSAIYVGYYAYLESDRGQTLGKTVMNIKTIGPDGQNPTMEQAVRRNAWYALGIIPLIGGILSFAAAIGIAVTISNSPTNEGWHDKFAGGTQVIKVG